MRLYIPFIAVLQTLICAQEVPYVPLGTSSNFALIAGAAISSELGETISGNVALYPEVRSKITGLLDEQVDGGIHAQDDTDNNIAAIAKQDAQIAYNAARSFASTVLRGSDKELGGQTLGTGVYKFDSEAQITGRLTLIGGTYDVFVFQIASTLITSALSEVYLDGDAQACNVFWQVGSSATLSADSMMTGRVLAQISITAGDQVIVDGGLVALTGAITLQYGFVEGIAECDRDSGLPPPLGTTTSSTTISTFSITSTFSSNVPGPSVSAPTIGEAAV